MRGDESLQKGQEMEVEDKKVIKGQQREERIKGGGKLWKKRQKIYCFHYYINLCKNKYIVIELIAG